MLSVVGLVVLAGAFTQRIVAGGTAVLWPSAEIKWADNAAIKGAKIAVLWGDPKTGGYGALKSIPGGSSMRLHTHTHDQKVIVLSGRVVLTLEGQAGKELTPGSYAFIPGGLKHVAECKAGADCSYFEEQSGASDVKFADEAGK
jgi:quercetin dioxygenase-like cupin family protein